MKRFILLALLLFPCLGWAATAPLPPAEIRLLEANFDVSFAGRAAIAEGTRELGRLSSSRLDIGALRAVPLDASSGWLVGAGWERFAISMNRAMPVPRHLDALALKLGYYGQLNSRWSLRAEIAPGIYSDLEDVGSDYFNAPLTAGLIFAASTELKWVLGTRIDARSATPVIPGIGARWQFAKDWTLVAVFPEPHLDYAVSPTLTVSAGASLRGGTYRVASDFGRRNGRPFLDHQDVGYRELTGTVAGRWQLSPAQTITVSAGWLFDRRFEFDDRNLLFNGDGAVAIRFAYLGKF